MGQNTHVPADRTPILATLGAFLLLPPLLILAWNHGRAVPPLGAHAASPPVAQDEAAVCADLPLRLDAGGHLRVDAELRDAFDRWLADADRHRLRGLLQACWSRAVGPLVAAQALDLHDRYAAYRDAVLREAAGAGVMSEQLLRIRALRQIWFDARDRGALFADEAGPDGTPTPSLVPTGSGQWPATVADSEAGWDAERYAGRSRPAVDEGAQTVPGAHDSLFEKRAALWGIDTAQRRQWADEQPPDRDAGVRPPSRQ